MAYITNGAGRDLPSTILDGIELGGLKIRSGDLLDADLHGILSIPPGAAKRLPALATEIQYGEQRFIQRCLDGNFSIERLAAAIEEHTHELQK